MELHPAGKTAAGDGPPVPVYMIYPDSVGAIETRVFLESPSDKIAAFFNPGLWRINPPTNAEKNFLLSLRALMDGRLGEARDFLAAASKGLPRRFHGCQRSNTALMLYLSGLPNEAESDWRKALSEGGPAAEGAWRNLYSLYLGRKDFAKAHGLVEAALVNAPKNKWAVAAKGYLLHMLRPDDEVGEFLREKSSWKDSLFLMQIAYGKFLKDRGQLSEAVKYYNRGLEGAPANGPGWLELGDIYYHQGYLVFAETCVRKAFHFGVNDPYIFELYGLVLRDLGRGTVDSAQAREIWKVAERVLEEGFAHDLHSRSMAQLLYHLYSGNGKVDAAENLRAGFWFHFTGPAPPGRPPALGPSAPPNPDHLIFRMSYVTFPLVAALQSTDFYEPF